MGAGGGRGRLEIACDESGFVGGSLFGDARVFAHASVHVDTAEAALLVQEVRRRTRADGEELKASRLIRPWARPVARWLCGPEGPLAGRVVVHVTDTRLFGAARLGQVLLGESEPDGWRAADADPEAWAHAVRLHRALAALPADRAREFRHAARDLLWLRRPSRPRASVDSWLEVASATAAGVPASDRGLFSALAGDDARRRANAYRERPPAAPLTEPLLPALRWAVHHWSGLGDPAVVHDEQSVLTPARLEALAADVAATFPGRRLLAVTRTDSRTDPRVQLADLVAGVVRRTVQDHLADGPDGPPDAVPVGHLLAAGSVLGEDDRRAWT